MIYANTSMLAATRGGKLEPLSVIDFLPSDSVQWQKRTRIAARGIKNPLAQSQIIKRAFGFQ